jgi:hypothetical protein
MLRDGRGPHGDRATAPPRAGARALAARALVRLSDMPGGWTAKRVSVPDFCCREAADPFAGARAVATSPRLLRGDNSLQATVGLFATTAAGRRAFARSNARPALACLRRNARQRMSDEAGSLATPLELLRLEETERWERAMRYAASADGPIGAIDGYIEVVHRRAGRALGAVVIVSTPTPIDDDVYERVVERFAGRLRTASR